MEKEITFTIGQFVAALLAGCGIVTSVAAAQTVVDDPEKEVDV